MTIIKHISSGRKYILVGTGYGATATTQASALFGNLSHSKSREHFRTLCVADASGSLHWTPAEEFTLHSVDGIPCEEFAEQLK